MNKITIIIFGMTGDLVCRKLLPALYHMIKEGALKNSIIVGAALENTTIEKILTKARTCISDCDERCWQELADCCYYQQLDATKLSDYEHLYAFIQEQEKSRNLPGNRLLYCSVASDFFCPITINSVESGIIERRSGSADPWMRIVYEKPFGLDSASAKKINECIALLLDESQVYRIDHYLTEELIANIALVRFTNTVFEPLWNKKYISQVSIVLNEKIGIENRGLYYDKYGAIKDVVQNHVLELLALIGMESPRCLSGECIRVERTEVLKHVRFIDGILGQYENYRHEPGVAIDSNTETFAALMLAVDTPRWKEVPFFVKTGKSLREKETYVHIQFKHAECLLAKNCPSAPNALTIQVTPNPSFALTLNVKKPNMMQEVQPVNMTFCHADEFKGKTAESYEVLLEEVMRGEQAVSVRVDEIEEAWKVIDAIKAQELPVYQYAAGSDGPDEFERFAKKHGMRW